VTAERQYLPQDLVYKVRLARRLRHGQVSDVALIVALLCVSGDPAFLLPAGKETTYAVLAALLACALLFNRRLGGRAFRAYLPVGFVFATLSIFQAYAFDFFPMVTVMGFLTRLFIGMAVVVIVSDFVRAYVLAMAGLSSLSFLFLTPGRRPFP
jgi:hypothetical protein